MVLIIGFVENAMMRLDIKEIGGKMNNQRRNNLEKCYKFVYVCLGCKKPYGSDLKCETVKNYCPICVPSHSNNGRSRWK
jgi:rRNA maturation endonuclease Nob1